MKKMKPWKKIILSVFMIIVIFGGVATSYTFYELSKIKTVKISRVDVDLGIKPEVVKKIETGNKITNIALFGLDRRDANEPSRSDSIMILSIDEKHKKMKMTSIMRDTFVDIKGHGKTKINHAYAYGGAPLAIKTLNENFNLNIRDYVTVDFFNFEKLIDAIGAVTIDIRQDEISTMNSCIGEVSRIEKKIIPQITKSGPQVLNGLQAVAYSRVRYTAGGDFQRTERQRTVLAALLTKIQSLGVKEFPTVVSKLLPYTETSIVSMDIIKLGKEVISFKKASMEQERFPLDGYCSGKTIDGVWYLVPNMDATVDQLHKYIYEDVKPVSKNPLF